MKKNLLVFIAIVTSLMSFAQNDSVTNIFQQNNDYVDSQINQIPKSLNNNNPNFDTILEYQSKIQTQKLLKNLFIIGFIFMSLLSIFLFYINNVKIKQILNMVKVQERQIDIKNFEVEKLSIILHQSNDGIYIVDQNNNINWYNNSFLKIYNYTEQDIENEKFDFFHSEDENIQKLLDKVKNEKRPVQFSFEVKNKKGEYLYIQRKILPLSDDKNDVTNYAIIDTDLTALKLALDKNEK